MAVDDSEYKHDTEDGSQWKKETEARCAQFLADLQYSIVSKDTNRRANKLIRLLVSRTPKVP